MSLGPMQLLIIALVILVLFGRGRISEMMGDFGKGIKSFKQGMNDPDESAEKPAARIESPAPRADVPAAAPHTATTTTTDPVDPRV